MSDHNGNGKVGKFLLIEELSGRVVARSEYDVCGLEHARFFDEQGQILEWDYIQKLSHKQQSKITVVQIVSKLSDLH